MWLTLAYPCELTDQGPRVHVHAAPGNTNRVVGGEQIPVQEFSRIPMV